MADVFFNDDGMKWGSNLRDRKDGLVFGGFLLGGFYIRTTIATCMDFFRLIFYF